MLSFVRIPSFFQPRRSFRRLRSFHLTPREVQVLQARQFEQAKAKNLSGQSRDENAVVLSQPNPIIIPSNFVAPVRGKTVVIFALLASLFFIASISFAFLGADIDEPYFLKALNTAAEQNPGLVLVGENVDVDVDEPSVGVRWSIIACGDDFVLPGSFGVHGSTVCGLPGSALDIYVDSDDDPTASYDPEAIPFDKESGHRRSIQNLVQFDSDHVLDVHEARLYPFDTYKLSSTIRAISKSTNKSVPISRIVAINIVSSFDIATSDLESYSSNENGTRSSYSRDFDMNIARPPTARLFALLLFMISWILTHVTVGHVMLAKRLRGLKAMVPHLISSAAILIAIPQLRATMPDAPGFDGVLIDTIGYFPQMVIVAISTIILLLMIVVREFDKGRQSTDVQEPLNAQIPIIRCTPPNGHQSSILSQSSSIPHSRSSSVEIAQWEMQRMLKHLKGQYVFPPVKPSHRLKPSEDNKNHGHRRVKTMSKIMEAGEVSHFSDSEDDTWNPNYSPKSQRWSKKSKPKPF
ncbi:hypothetical protein CPB83DRAFT_529765 [Crepidotus variabilis]|uniref:Uncharacterized protein n=1 Tax=Crepidotus variabilis TaxID=179855 RepID=A0A9P6EQ79_9AGAR|nr:hypothetical protein CPB83DRAFT_529765 [Crepidotus variabilis]